MTSFPLDIQSTQSTPYISPIPQPNLLNALISEKRSEWISQMPSTRKMLKIPKSATDGKHGVYLVRTQPNSDVKLLIKTTRISDRTLGSRSSLWYAEDVDTGEKAFLAKTAVLHTSTFQITQRSNELLHKFQHYVTLLDSTFLHENDKVFQYRCLTSIEGQNSSLASSFFSLFIYVLDLLEPIVQTELLIERCKDEWIADFELYQRQFYKIPKSETGGKFAIYIVREASNRDIKIFIHLGDFHIGQGSSKRVTLALDYFNNSNLVALAKTSYQDSDVYTAEQIASIAWNEAEFLQMFPGSERLLQTTYLGERTNSKGIEKQYLFLPYFSNGNLLDAIPNLNYRQKVYIALDLLNAFVEFHGTGACYQDAKIQNILLDENFRAFLSDFGLSRVHNQDLGIFGSIAWMPPEKLEWSDTGYSLPNAWGQPIDIWGLGAIFYSMFIDRDAYAVLTYNMYKSFDLTNSVSQNILVAIAIAEKHNIEAAQLKSPIHTLIHQMMSNDIAARPTAMQARAQLLELINLEFQ